MRQLRRQKKAEFTKQTLRLANSDTNDIDIAILFPGCKWSDEKMVYEHILQ